MYSNVNAVGDIAELEYATAKIVDKYFEKHPNVNPDDYDEIDKIYELVLEELNVEHLRSVIEWRIRDLIDGTAEEIF